MPARKKQSKLRTILSKLNPNSPKKKFILFIAVFAVLGGGYFAYKSFAGDQAHFWYADQIGSSGYAYKATESRGLKRGMTVWVSFPGTRIGSFPAQAIFAPKIRYCAYVAPVGGAAGITISGKAINTDTVTLAHHAISGEYQRYCTNWVPNNDWKAARQVQVEMHPPGIDGYASSMKVSSLSIEYRY
jgi:hypothetical protein